MTNHQNLKEIIDQKFDPISQKIDNIMVRVINSYILPDSTLDKMIKLVDKHIINHKEYGFNLCLKNNNINYGKLCKGKKCSVKIDKPCKKDEKHIGTYHTHYLTFVPSARDLLSGYLDEITCIGDKEKVLCLKKKQNDIYVFSKIVNLFETEEELSRKLRNKEITDREHYEGIRDNLNKLADLVHLNYKIFVYKHGEPLTVEDIEKMQKWEEEQRINE